MIDTKSFIRCRFGDFWAIGGEKPAIDLLHNSLYNFNGINSTELISLGSDEFGYLLVKEQAYLNARSRNMVINLEWNYKGKNGKLPWGIAMTRAKLELNSIKYEDFLKTTPISDKTYDFSEN